MTEDSGIESTGGLRKHLRFDEIRLTPKGEPRQEQPAVLSTMAIGRLGYVAHKVQQYDAKQIGTAEDEQTYHKTFLASVQIGK